MRLILFRHGLAMEREDWEKTSHDDSLRPLVEKGKAKTKEMGEVLHCWVPEVDMLVSSPYARAVQTANILKPLLKAPRVVESVELVPSAPPRAFCQWLQEQAAHAQTVVAVGHEPHLSSLASWLLSGHSESFIVLKKSGIIELEVESFEDLGPFAAELRCVVQPKMLE